MHKMHSLSTKHWPPTWSYKILLQVTSASAELWGTPGVAIYKISNCSMRPVAMNYYECKLWLQENVTCYPEVTRTQLTREASVLVLLSMGKASVWRPNQGKTPRMELMVGGQSNTSSHYALDSGILWFFILINIMVSQTRICMSFLSKFDHYFKAI